jgi:hypothetical protein
MTIFNIRRTPSPLAITSGTSYLGLEGYAALLSESVHPQHSVIAQELTDKRLRRDSFTSVQQLIDSIDLWTEHWNDDPKPFIWHKTAEEIIAKVKRGRAALDQITNSATDH